MGTPPTDWAELQRLSDAATPGPWQFGDSSHVAGVMAERYGEGRCAYCDAGEPSWVGSRSINGTRMLAHVHLDPEPWWRHGIYAIRADGPVSVVNDTDEYGYMADADAAFIAAAREAVPALLAEVAGLRAELATRHDEFGVLHGNGSCAVRNSRQDAEDYREFWLAEGKLVHRSVGEWVAVDD